MSRRILLNAFDMNCPTHLVSGTWKHPESQGWRYKDLGYWTELAALLERGHFDGLFIADVIGVYDVFAGGPEAALRAGAQIPVNDPLLLISAMAHVTEHLGFGITASTSYEHPYTFARRMSTLDHLTEGRIGWNIVTSYLNSGALNVGLEGQVRHDNRYDIADEYLEVVYKLWEGSWDDDAVVRDVQRGIYADPDRVHPIGHDGTYYRVPGIHMAEPSPQRTPLLYQAGASPRGRQFAAENAEAIFMNAPSAEVLAGQIRDVRARAVALGRDEQDIKVFSGYAVITGETRAEVARKRDLYRSLTEPEGTLALWSGWMGFDLSPYDLDDPVKLVASDAVQSMADTFGSGDWRVRDLVDHMSFGPAGPVAVGTGPEVADQIEEWIWATGADGLNISHVITPGSYADFATYVVPELQRRGAVPSAYERGTLRHKLFGGGDRLPASHRGASFRRRRSNIAAPVGAPVGAGAGAR